jgi:PTH1 family peptidyl-tRNA hydrolase
MKLVVGLGNPGTAYSDNRHNVGFMAIAHFARTHHLRFDRKRGNARVAEGDVADTSVVLARPQTFMNASGQAVNQLLRKLKLSAEDLIVIHDDLDLPLGRIRVRLGGSSGGHKGVQSIIGDIGTAEFVRVRVGIGRPGRAAARDQGQDDVIDYVLGGFTSPERTVLAETIGRVTEVLQFLIERGLAETMNKFNPPLPPNKETA